MAITREQVIEALKKVNDPELNKSLVDLGMVKDIEIAGPHVRVTIALTMAGCPLKDKIKSDVKEALSAIPGIGEVRVVLTTMTSAERAKLFGQEPSEMEGMKGVKNVIAVASGKGGVGKSTVAVNLAAALAKKGYKVGILDADMHGPDIPIMLGIKDRPVGSRGMLFPLEKYGIKMMSTGTLAGDGTPIVWRGPLVNKAIKEFLGHVAWGDLDYLIVDLPPGTGDAPLTVATTIPIRGVIIVTTPQKVALSDVRRNVGLFLEHKIPILGIVENMSYLKVPGSDEVMDIFGSGGGEKIAKAFKLPLLAKIPIDPQIRQGGDEGRPVALEEGEASKAFYELADKVIAEVEKKNSQNNNK
ncbi:MAG: Mrp/NBP35 family ATP-binding protein [Thermodesulfobacteria bacterium]|nr:Mrp/NBP35 family ATP-binding protein [Thermodesulfobacteriota bacterium]